MEQHDLPVPNPPPRHQRRVVGQCRDGRLRKVRAGLGKDLRRHGHIGGQLQAVEGRGLGKGRKRLRLPPAHRAADGAATDPEPDGQQRVKAVAAHIG